MMTQRHKHDDKKMTKFEIEYEMKRKKGWWTQPFRR